MGARGSRLSIFPRTRSGRRSVVEAFERKPVRLPRATYLPFVNGGFAIVLPVPQEILDDMGAAGAEQSP